MRDGCGYLRSVRVPARLRGVVDADDLRQTVMLRFYARGAEFRWRSDAERRSYLHQILASVLIDALRREARTRRSGGRAVLAVEEVPADWTSPSRKAIRNERQARLIEAIAALPKDQRTAVTLYYLEGRTLTETAEIMGKTVFAVAGLIRRALFTLRRQLGDDVEF